MTTLISPPMSRKELGARIYKTGRELTEWIKENEKAGVIQRYVVPVNPHTTRRHRVYCYVAQQSGIDFDKKPRRKRGAK